MEISEKKLMGIRVTVHRGTNQIGGCVTEYECRGFHLFVDYGEQLPGYEHTDLEIEGLTKGNVSNSALLITHYHGDHIGKVSDLSNEIPIYMGKTGCEIYREFELHMAHIPGEKGERHRLMADRVGKFRHFEAGHPFKVGPFKIIPIVMDHSAFDAYAFKIEADGCKVFHTGDFRTHGFRSKTLPTVIEKYIGKVDCVVSEGTNIERSMDVKTKSEHDVKKELMDDFKENKYNVVYVSSTNIDRLFALYHAACSAGRMFILDEFAKKMMDAAANVDKVWGKSRFYHFLEGQKPLVLWKNVVINDTFYHAMERHGYVLIARANDRFAELLKKMPSEGRMVYLSMWKGYVDHPESPAFNKRLAEAVGNDYVHIHTSGHCDVENMNKLFEMLEPKVIIPIHTNSQEKFATAFPSWHVKLLEDGEIFSTNPFGDIPVHEEGDTILSAFCISENLESDDDLKISSVDEKLKCWKLDYKDVSSFNNSEQARDALKYVRAGKNVIAFEIWEECDFALTIGEVYRRDKTFYANLDSKSHFASRETALAIMRLPSSWYLVPVEVMGPATKEALKKVHDEGLLDVGYDSFDEFYEQYEPVAYYEPDMIVKPLVDIETFEGKVLCELVSARYLFSMDDVVEHRESKSLESVYPEIAKAPLPTTGEVEAILARFKAGEQGADEELKHACIRFVASVAKQFVGRGLSPKELLSIGIEGVLDAARNDQLSSGVSFQKYMIVYVKQAIVDAITHR